MIEAVNLENMSYYNKLVELEVSHEPFSKGKLKSNSHSIKHKQGVTNTGSERPINECVGVRVPNHPVLIK